MIQAVALGLVLETALFALSGFIFLRRRGYTFAEAGAGTALLLFMAVSLVHQLDLAVGSFWPGLLAEILALFAILAGAIRRRPAILHGFLPAGRLIRQEPVPVMAMAGTWAVIALHMIAGWRGATSQLSGVGGGWVSVHPAGLSGLEPTIPLNAPALFQHASRFGLPAGACGFGLLAYMSVGFSTYALARRYAWPPMALTITLVVLSMPRLVRLACYPSAELISAAAVGLCVLLLYRLVEQHQVLDLYLFLLSLGFSVHAHPMSVALVPVLALLAMLVMIRRHGWLMLHELIASRPVPMALSVGLFLIMAQVPVFASNLAGGRPLLGTAVLFDTDGIIGAMANLIRYLFVSLDPTEALRGALVWLVGLDLEQVMMGLYNVLVVSLFGRSGASAPFVPVFSGSGPAGFGPFAALLVLPAMLHAALRGPRRLKALSVAWAGYLYLAALILAWTSDNLAVLTPLYVANGFMMAFALPPWRLRRRGMRLLQALCVLLLIGALTWGAGPLS